LFIGNDDDVLIFVGIEGGLTGVLTVFITLFVLRNNGVNRRCSNRRRTINGCTIAHKYDRLKVKFSFFPVKSNCIRLSVVFLVS
jgi:hypothetical protein